MKARTIRETEYTWEQIEEILAAGKARETFGEDGQITVQVEGIGTALLNILDYDKDKAADPDIPHTHHGYLHNENDGAKGAANLTPKEKRMVESVTDKWYNRRGK